MGWPPYSHRETIRHQNAASAQWLAPHHPVLPNVKHVTHPRLHRTGSSTQARRACDFPEQRAVPWRKRTKDGEGGSLLLCCKLCLFFVEILLFLGESDIFWLGTQMLRCCTGVFSSIWFRYHSPSMWAVSRVKMTLVNWQIDEKWALFTWKRVGCNPTWL